MSEGLYLGEKGLSGSKHCKKDDEITV